MENTMHGFVTYWKTTYFLVLEPAIFA